MFRRWHRFRSQQGSLPLALIVVILVGGLVVVLVARTLTAQSQVRFDQTYHGALPGADAAVEISKFWLNQGTELERDLGGGASESLHPREFEEGWFTVWHEDEADGRAFTWMLTKTGEMTWEIEASSVDPRTDVERRVLATIEEQPLVDVAAFAEMLLLFRGANQADSYNSNTEEWCTGHGFVASNHDVEFTGGAAGPAPRCGRPTGRTVDRVLLYNWGPPPDGDYPGTVSSPDKPGGDRCDNDSNHANCTEVNEDFLAPRIFPQYLELSTGGDGTDFIEDAIEACEDRGDLEEEFRATNHALAEGILDAEGRLRPAPDAEEAMLDPKFDMENAHYCFKRMVFDRDVELSALASKDNPVIIFVRDEVLLDRGAGAPAGGRNVDVGCPPGDGCHRGPHADQTYPEAAGLIIFVLNGDISLRNHSQFAGVMYAPDALCHGANSNAQADIYGAILCKDIGNAGGWRFHFDDALWNLHSGKFIRAEWRELPS